MPSALEQLLEGILVAQDRPNPDELQAQIKMDLDILERMWLGEDRDSASVRGFVASARIWYEFLDNAAEGSKVNSRVSDGLSHFIAGIHKSLDELQVLGRLRCDAIESATGTNPLPEAEEKQMREDLMESLRQRRATRGDNPHPGDAAWASAAEPTG